MLVLFVCVHNGGRSVMAEAFFNGSAPSGIQAVSAGTIPQDQPHPAVVDAMAEIGLDVSEHRGRMLDDDLVQLADRIITMGCAVDEAACPAISLADVVDWGLPDPKGAPPPRVRRIRDEVRARVDALIAELTARTP